MACGGSPHAPHIQTYVLNKLCCLQKSLFGGQNPTRSLTSWSRIPHFPSPVSWQSPRTCVPYLPWQTRPVVCAQCIAWITSDVILNQSLVGMHLLVLILSSEECLLARFSSIKEFFCYGSRCILTWIALGIDSNGAFFACEPACYTAVHAQQHTTKEQVLPFMRCTSVQAAWCIESLVATYIHTRMYVCT